jgi:hypothetical protein
MFHVSKHVNFQLIVIGGVILPVCVAMPSMTPAAYANPPNNYRDGSGLMILSSVLRDPIPTKVADAYDIAYRINGENPDEFGYPLVRDGRVVLPVISGDTNLMDITSEAACPGSLKAYRGRLEARGSSGFEATKQMAIGAGTVDILCSEATIIKGDISRHALEDIQHSVFDLGSTGKFKAHGIWQSEIDPFTGHVIVRTESLPADLADLIVDRAGTQIVQVLLEPSPGTMPQGRIGDTSPFLGGVRINISSTGSSCTTAFSWVNGTASMLLTAGHCAPSGGSVSTTAASVGIIASGIHETWTHGIGTVFTSGSSTYRGDLALITVTGSSTSSFYMYRGGSTSSTTGLVNEMWNSWSKGGEQYCVGGSTVGEVCGYVVDRAGVDHKYDNGEVVRHAVVGYKYSSTCTQGGDSGGPVYTVKGDGTIAAKGIYGGGGSDGIGGTVDPRIEVFTDILDAYQGFPGVLRTP